MITIFIMITISIALSFLIWLDDGDSRLFWEGFILIVIMTAVVWLWLPDRLVEKAEKTITTAVEMVYIKENSETNQQEYIKSRKEEKHEETYWYYVQESEIVVPKGIPDNGHFKIKYTNETPYVEIIKVTSEKNFLNKWSPPHAFGSRPIEEIYYIFNIPEGFVSDEIYLEHSSNFDEATIIKETQKH